MELQNVWDCYFAVGPVKAYPRIRAIEHWTFWTLKFNKIIKSTGTSCQRKIQFYGLTAAQWWSIKFVATCLARNALACNHQANHLAKISFTLNFMYWFNVVPKMPLTSQTFVSVDFSLFSFICVGSPLCVNHQNVMAFFRIGFVRWIARHCRAAGQKILAF